MRDASTAFFIGLGVLAAGAGLFALSLLLPPSLRNAAAVAGMGMGVPGGLTALCTGVVLLAVLLAGPRESKAAKKDKGK